MVTVGDAFVGVGLVGEGGRATKSSVSEIWQTKRRATEMHRTVGNTAR